MLVAAVALVCFLRSKFQSPQLSRPQLSAFNDANAATRRATLATPPLCPCRLSPSLIIQAGSSGPGHNQWASTVPHWLRSPQPKTNIRMTHYPGQGRARNPLTVGPKCTRRGRRWIKQLRFPLKKAASFFVIQVSSTASSKLCSQLCYFFFLKKKVWRQLANSAAGIFGPHGCI